MEPVSMALGAATGVAKGIKSLVSLVRARRARRRERKRVAAIPSKTEAGAGHQVATSGGSMLTGQNPVAQAGMQSTMPVLAQPAALATGTIKRKGLPSSLNQAKQSFLFQAAMNGDKL